MKEKIKEYAAYAIVALLIITSFFFFRNAITGNLVKTEKIVIYFPTTIDLPNKEESTLNFEFSFPAASFKVGNKTADVLMFLESGVMPGLKIAYHTANKKVYAGLPVIESDAVELLDGNMHLLTYTFSRKEQKQIVTLDNQVIAEGIFTGEQMQSPLTGMVVYDGRYELEAAERVESPIEMRVSVK